MSTQIDEILKRFKELEAMVRMRNEMKEKR